MSIVNNNSSSEILQSGTSAANAGYYPVVEIFNTLQGEGHHAGRSACFVRLAGCDVGCRWCDTPGSWKAGHYPPVDATSIKGEASCSDAAIVVVTGGEPAMYDLAPLCDGLSKTGKQLHLETCGAYPLTGSWHWICVSPKRNRPPLPANLALADELKVIVYDRDDLEWAEHQAEKVRDKCLLFLQPEWGKKKEMLPVLIQYIKKHDRWRLSLQIHKYAGIR